MRPIILVAAAALSLAPVLSACGAEQPVGRDPGFAGFPGGTRVLALYAQDQAEVTREVTVPDGTRQLALRMDCVGATGTIKVAVGDLGAGAVPCQDSSQPSGFIGLSGADVAGKQAVTVRAPKNARWSVAVDAR